MLKNYINHFFILLLFIFIISGCKSQSGVSSNDAIPTPIPQTSKFSKVQIGWSIARVHDVIGKPTDTRTYLSGKTFIPMYFGSDRARIEDLYKGEGRIIYTGGSGLTNQGYTVFKIIYDPTESGYNDKK